MLSFTAEDADLYELGSDDDDSGDEDYDPADLLCDRFEQRLSMMDEDGKETTQTPQRNQGEDDDDDDPNSSDDENLAGTGHPLAVITNEDLVHPSMMDIAQTTTAETQCGATTLVISGQEQQTSPPFADRVRALNSVFDQLDAQRRGLKAEGTLMGPPPPVVKPSEPAPKQQKVERREPPAPKPPVAAQTSTSAGSSTGAGSVSKHHHVGLTGGQADRMPLCGNYVQYGRCEFEEYCPFWHQVPDHQTHPNHYTHYQLDWGNYKPTAITGLTDDDAGGQSGDDPFSRDRVENKLNRAALFDAIRAAKSAKAAKKGLSFCQRKDETSPLEVSELMNIDDNEHDGGGGGGGEDDAKAAEAEASARQERDRKRWVRWNLNEQPVPTVPSNSESETSGFSIASRSKMVSDKQKPTLSFSDNVDEGNNDDDHHTAMQ